MSKEKKQFKETKLGKFLVKIAPKILDVAGDLLPDAGLLNMIKNLIEKDTKITPENKEHAMKLLEIDIIEMQEISKHWESDMKSDSWLSKNTRPLMLIFLTISAIFLILLDSLTIKFDVDSEWIELLKSLLVTVYVAYFGSRGIEKYKTISNNN